MKKNFLKSLVILSLLASAPIRTYAQNENVPVSSTLTGTANADSIIRPLPYDQGANASYSNANQSTPRLNYSRTWVPHVPVSDTSQGFVLNGTNDYSAATTYSNGWGQTLQTTKRGGWVCKDVVSANDLRPSLTQTAFLPYNKTKNSKFVKQPFVEQKAHYNGLYAEEQATSYAQRKVDLSQSTPQMKGFAPGRAFIGHAAGDSVTILPNGSTEIPILTVSGGSLTSPGYYSSNQLVLKIVTGEHNAQTKQYYDKSKRLICSKVYAGLDNSSNPIWLTTYNVYDKFGRLIAVVPPRVADNYGLGYTQGQCFTYEYDDRGNVISSHTPAQLGNNTIVYDRKHRAVLSQTPNLDGENKWLFTIYDKAGRVVMTGLFSDNHNQAYLQHLIDTISAPTSGSLMYYLVNEFSGTYPSTFTSITNCEIQVMNYYDGYSNSFFSGTSYNNTFTALYKSGAEMITPEVNYFSYKLLTGKKTAVLGDTTLNAAVNSRYYYDSRGRLIQVQTQNPWNTSSNYDVTLYQYNFSGQKVLEVNKHYAPNDTNNTKPKTVLQTSYNYSTNQDSRLVSVEQKIDDSQWRNIASYFYDDMGRISKKILGGVETQDYDYDMRGQLSGINSVYSEFGPLNTTNKTFGCRLMKDYGFSAPRYDGRLSGYYWRGSGNMPERAYGYTYDPAGRVIHAEFRENSVSTYMQSIDINGDTTFASGLNWNKQHTDYTVSKLAYDKGGNILSMNQVGNPITQPKPKYIDVLGYFYNAANRLTSVRDAIALNYNLDDFLDRSCSGVPGYEPDDELGGGDPGDPQEIPVIEPYYTLPNPPPTPDSAESCDDYEYDANGNLTFDNNKGILEITYNQFNLPVDITVNNGSLNIGGTIHHVYGANGALLQKTVIDTVANDTSIYSYWGPFVYRNDSLLYILHQDGRARYIASQDSFRYDYFVKDHQGNVRTVITADLVNGNDYVASHELASANLESSVFFNVNKVRTDNPFPTFDDVKAASLDGAVDSLRIGTAILLHVMPGDQLEISAKSLWEEDTTVSTYTAAEDMVSALLGTLAGGEGGYTGNEGPSTRMLEDMLNLTTYENLYDAIKEDVTDPSLPRAYLNYMMFDNDMDLIGDKSGAVQVHATPGSWQHISPGAPLLVEQEGYALIYISNEQHKKIKFDDVDVAFFRGRLIQEQHYYPYGLSIKEGEGTEEKNKFKFEGNSKLDELGLQLYDFHARQYDPQIGRFWGVDPLADAQVSLNPYHFCSGDPANFTDPTGLIPDLAALMERLGKQRALWRQHEIEMGIIPAYMARGFTGMGAGGGGGNQITGGSGALALPGVAGDYTSSNIKYFAPNQIGTMAINGVTHAVNGLGDILGTWKTVSAGQGSNKVVWSEESQSFEFIDLPGIKTVYERKKSIGERIWNSPIARYYVPDVFSISIGGDVFVELYGGGVTPVNITFLMRGKDAGIYTVPSFTVKAGVGGVASGNITATRSWFTGNPSDITADMLPGKSYGIEAELGVGLDLSAGYSTTPAGDENFININFGVGFGEGASFGGQTTYAPSYGTIFTFFK